MQVRKFMEVLYETRTAYNEQDVLSQLPPALAQELLNFMYRNVLTHVAIFKNLEEGAITQLCMRVKPFSCLKGDVVYTHGEVGREVFIVVKGSVSVFYKNNSAVITDTTWTDVTVADATLPEGSTFGEGCAVALFASDTDEKPAPPYTRKDTVAVATDCELKFLTLADLSEVCADFPSVRAEMWSLVCSFEASRHTAVGKHMQLGTDDVVKDATVHIAKNMATKLGNKLQRTKSARENSMDPKVSQSSPANPSLLI